MKLFEHPDFEQLVLRADEHFRSRGVRPAIIEKDYYAEKLFAIHGKVELFKRDGRPIGTYARHYYDLFKLSGQEAVITMLKSGEYAAIKEDYDKISREYFPNSYFYPKDMRFANSDALFPPRELSPALERDYETQCKQLCYGPYPPWAEVLNRFESLREVL